MPAHGSPADTVICPAERPRLRGEVRMLVKMLRPGDAARRARQVLRDTLTRSAVPEDQIIDAELAVAEIAANADRHACPPYELRVFSLCCVPVWCEVVDGDPDAAPILAILTALHGGVAPDPLAESGRGLPMVHALTAGYCLAYPTTLLRAGDPAKAVAFALPTPSGTRLLYPHLFKAARRSL
jgi:anti-sigma regulatory factor (Ser/Thr protein kinase)